MHLLIMLLLTIALVCDAQEIRSSDLVEFLLAGSVMVALVVYDLVRDGRTAPPA
jgi:hypothetical protein